VEAILEMAEYKKSGRARKLIVAGCLVERYRDAIRQEVPEVDAIIAPMTSRASWRYARAWRGRRFHPSRTCITTSRARALDSAPFRLHQNRGRLRPPCTFCVIPQYRGHFRSRRLESVVSEAARLFETGRPRNQFDRQDTTSYGEDLGLTDGLARLLERLAQIETRARNGSASSTPTPPGHARAAGHPGRASGAGQVHRHAVAARERPRPQAYEARRVRRSLPETARAHSPDHPRVAIRTSFITGFPARRPKISKSCAGSSRPPGSTTWGSSLIPMKTPAPATPWTRKWTAAPSTTASAASWPSSGRSRAPAIARWWRGSARARRRPVARDRSPLDGAPVHASAEIDGVVLINDFEIAEPRPGEIRRLRVTEATITMWWARFSPHGTGAELCRPGPGQHRAMNCPICKKEVAPGDPEFPFCSERCRIIDLGNWATGKYVIPSPSRKMKKNHSARCFPPGLVRVRSHCPRTAGSLAALLIAIALHAYAGFAWWHFLLLAAIGFWPAVWAAGVTARATGIEDPGFVVIDEVLGQWIALAGAHPFNWKSCLAAFALFRLFDIWKPRRCASWRRCPADLASSWTT